MPASVAYHLDLDMKIGQCGSTGFTLKSPDDGMRQCTKHAHAQSIMSSHNEGSL